jgi:hypothetical protein
VIKLSSGIRVKGFRDSARTGECVVSSGTVLFGDQNQPGISFQILYYLKRHRVRVVSVIRWWKRREEDQACQEGCVMLICGSIILSDNYRLSLPATVAPRACVCVGVLMVCVTISEPTRCYKRYLLDRMNMYESVDR